MRSASRERKIREVVRLEKKGVEMCASRERESRE